MTGAAIDSRPPVAVGHVRILVGDVGAAARWLETAGLRPIVKRDELAVLELRGGTHVVVRQGEQPIAPGTCSEALSASQAGLTMSLHSPSGVNDTTVSPIDLKPVSIITGFGFSMKWALS